MSVPKHMRSESPMEFMHNALKLEKEVTELLLRDGLFQGDGGQQRGSL